MKKISILSAVAVTALFNAQYCLPAFQYGSDSNMITNVTFGNINNTSSFQAGNAPVYENFTSMSTDIQAGGSYAISVKGPSSTFPSDVVVFIDLNQNGNFDDAGESFYIGRLSAANPANASTVSSTITIPANAVAGATRMRVLKNTNTAAYSNLAAPNSISTACDTALRAGQVEDYTVMIQSATSGFPSPYCGDENITTLTVSEISKVEFAGMTNDSNIDGSSTTIEDFTSTVFEVTRGISYPISVTGGTQGQASVSAYAYIDFNHNTIFEDQEKFNLGYLDNSNPVSHTQSGITTGSIQIPADAPLGQTRFRIVKAYESSSWMGTLENLPCPAGWFIGQVEDYTLNIQASNLATGEISKDASIKIYPNPTTGMVMIQNTDRLAKYEVYSMSGQKVMEGDTHSFTLEKLAAGTYFLKIQMKDKKIITEKIIKK